jgi:hypothetical protein
MGLGRGLSEGLYIIHLSDAGISREEIEILAIASEWLWGIGNTQNCVLSGRFHANLLARVTGKRHNVCAG